MDQIDETVSYCRQCGGERYHAVAFEKTRSWSEDDSPVGGADTWSVLECGGCRAVTFVHEHWFSEDVEFDESGPKPIVHRELFPPAPLRKMPEWLRGTERFLDFLPTDYWMVRLLKDIYAAIGMQHYALAARGTRSIVDAIVTSKAGGRGSFEKKLAPNTRDAGATGPA